MKKRHKVNYIGNWFNFHKNRNRNSRDESREYHAATGRVLESESEPPDGGQTSAVLRPDREPTGYDADDVINKKGNHSEPDRTDVDIIK